LSSSTTKLLLVGLDCADPALLQQWLDAGDLPVLQSLRERGSWGPLHSPPGLADDATWASFQTGVSPARHGRYFFHAIEPGSYRTPFWEEKHLQYPMFWETLSDAGKRVAVIDVPKSPLSRNINGVHVTDWRVHGRDRKTQSWPDNISVELLSRFGEDGTDCLSQNPWLCDARALAEENYDEFISALAKSADDKLIYAQELLLQGGWDMFLVVFKEAHCISHKFWHLLDASNPAYSSAFALRYGNAIKDIYTGLDRAIGILLETAGPDSNVIVFSDLGMASNYTGNFLFDEILRRLEFNRLSRVQRAIRQSQELAQAISHRLRGKNHEIDSRRIRMFYSLPNGEQSGAIRFNIAGREPAGMVSAGADCDALRDYLVDAFLELVDPESGAPLVDAVLSSAEIYPGPQSDRLPDLFVMWNRNRPISGAASKLIGEIRRPVPSMRSGGHIANGLYCFAGPAAVRQAQAVPASIMDLAPTAAALLGQPLSELDGNPLPARYSGQVAE
jgi:predicted AlkP superfamily phosphohydrolase/phosphomutase